MTAAETIEKCLYWQRHVLTHSTKPEQKERARRAIIKLEIELKQARGEK